MNNEDWEACIRDEIDHCHECEWLRKNQIDTSCKKHKRNELLDKKQQKLFNELVQIIPKG